MKHIFLQIIEKVLEPEILSENSYQLSNDSSEERAARSCQSFIHSRGLNCAHCDKSCPTTQSLQDRTSTYHDNVKFECAECKKMFRSQYKLQQHQRKEHKKRFECSYCRASFLKPSLRTRHENVKHEGLRYHCSVPKCARKFTSRLSALNHLRMHHSLHAEEFRKYSSKLQIK